jgi:uncharacterized membrane protein YcaP (DUF421 family)
MDTVTRIAVIYVALLLGFKVMGKREFGQLAPFEFLTLLMIPEIVSQSLTHDDYSITNALVGVTTLLVLVFLTSMASHLNRNLGKIIDGNPAVIVRHGFLVPENMNVERITPDEVMAELHRSGFEDLTQIKWAILEGDGKITFIPWVPELLVEGAEDQVSG